jgi:hypothetical protein
MADGKRRRTWTIGGLTRDDTGWRITKAREITEQEFRDFHSEVLFIRELAGLRDFVRVLDAVARWERALERAHAELTEGALWRGTVDALAMDLPAVVRSAERLEAALLAKVNGMSEGDTLEARAFRERLNHIRATPAYLLAYEMARQIAEHEPEFVVRDGNVFFARAPRLSAREITRGLVGQLFTLVAAYMNVFHDAFDRVGSTFENTADAVDAGTPSLIVYDVTDDDGPVNLTLVNLPLQEIAALREFFRQIAVSSDPERLARAGLTLTQSGLRTELRIGDEDIATGVVAGRTTQGVNALPTSTMKIDLGLLGSSPIDYWATVRTVMGNGSHEDEVFLGAVKEARIDEDVVALDCEGAVDLTEHNLSGLVAANVAPAELIRSTMLQAGLPPEALTLDDPAEISAIERFEIFVPVRGIEVAAAVDVGPVSIVSASRCEHALSELTFGADGAKALLAEFRHASSYAVAQVTARTLPEAEAAGWAAIETTIAWLVARGRYGFARLPDGSAQTFSRQESLRVPTTAPVVLVYAEETRRVWLRWAEDIGEPLDRPLDAESPTLQPPLPAELEPAERRALIALRRAVTEVDPEAQVQALWDSLESYAAGTTGPKLFSPSDLDRLRAAIPDGLTAAQLDKFSSAIGDLNRPPLGVRLDWRMREDGIPLGEGERDLLFRRLRRARNDATHGRPMQNVPSREEIHRGISLVARMIVYRVARREESIVDTARTN